MTASPGGDKPGKPGWFSAGVARGTGAGQSGGSQGLFAQPRRGLCVCWFCLTPDKRGCSGRSLRGALSGRAILWLNRRTSTALLPHPGPVGPWGRGGGRWGSFPLLARGRGGGQRGGPSGRGPRACVLWSSSRVPAHHGLTAGDTPAAQDPHLQGPQAPNLAPELFGFWEEVSVPGSAGEADAAAHVRQELSPRRGRTSPRGHAEVSRLQPPTSSAKLCPPHT